MENKDNITSSPTGEVKNKSIETYAEDMAKVIEGNQGELIKKIIHEQELHELEKKNLSPKSKQNRIFIGVGFLLLFITLGIFIFLGFFRNKINLVEISTPMSPIIFTDRNYFQDIGNLNRDSIILSIVNQVRNTEVKVGGVEAIYLTIDGRVIGLRNFLELIKSNFSIPPAPLIADNFLVGSFRSSAINGADEVDSNLFFLFKSKSFVDGFQSMRGWEGKMFNDLHGFFNVDISSATKELLSKDFVDGRISNKNARILYDNNGQIVLMYVFADENSIVISNSEGAIDEVILRLSSSQISK